MRARSMRSAPGLGPGGTYLPPAPAVPPAPVTTPAIATATHRLKCYPGQFRAVKRGDKCHEIRQDDRGFADGHRLLLQEWDPSDETFTGDELMVLVTHMTRGPDYGLPRGLVVMTIKPITMPPYVKGDHAEERRRRDALGAEDL